LEFSRQLFTNVPNIKFHANPSSWGRADKCGQTDTTKVTGACRDYANAPENPYIFPAVHFGVPNDHYNKKRWVPYSAQTGWSLQHKQCSPWERNWTFTHYNTAYCYECFVLSFILTLLLSEAQVAKPGKLKRKQCSYRYRGAMDRKVLS